MWRPFLVERAVGVWHAFEFPFVEPELFRGAPGRFGIEHAIVRHDALEAVGVTEDPVSHVSAVARAQRALAVFINEGIMLLGILEALHQVFKRSTAPVAVDRINKLLPVAG